MNPPNDNAQLLAKMTAELQRLEREPDVHLVIARPELFCLIAAVQLALRHPRYTGPSRDVTDQAVRRIATFAFANCPACLELIRRGFDPHFDVPSTH